MAKALKAEGFKFCGPTITYAFMEATGMVNDHLVTCPRHRVCAQHARRGVGGNERGGVGHGGILGDEGRSHRWCGLSRLRFHPVGMGGGGMAARGQRDAEQAGARNRQPVKHKALRRLACTKTETQGLG